MVTSAYEELTSETHVVIMEAMSRPAQDVINVKAILKYDEGPTGSITDPVPEILAHSIAVQVLLEIPGHAFEEFLLADIRGEHTQNCVESISFDMTADQ